MFRERGLKVVLVLVGLFFSAAIYPAIGGLVDPAHSDMGDTMMMSLYFAFGIFLLIAVRNPSAHGSLISIDIEAFHSLRAGATQLHKCAPTRCPNAPQPAPISS